MQMHHTTPLLLYFECWGEGRNLIDAAPIMPYGTDSPSWRVVVGVNPGASKASRPLPQLSFDAQELCWAATEFLQQGDLGSPVCKDLPIGFE